MALKTGTLLLIGLMVGMASGSRLETFVRDAQITALQVVQCSKGESAVKNINRL